MILDLFAGPGGWSEGLRLLGRSDIGMEWDEDACLTRAAANHRTIRCDVATYPTDAFGDVEGLIASPPCQAFSMAGTGAGRREIEHLHAAVETCRDGWTPPGREWEDERTPLILEPLRYADALRPEWIACEQVPPALRIWEHMADVLRSWGYDARAVKLHSEQWGVPQTRTRAFLLAHWDVVRIPKPTHQRYQNGVGPGEAQECEPSLFGPGLLPWVSMAEALGWTGWVSLDRRQNGAPVLEDMRERPCPSVTGAAFGAGVWRLVGNTSVAGEGRAERDANEPSLTVGSRADLWSLRAGTNENDVDREEGEPAPTIRFGDRLNKVEWVQRRDSGPAAERAPRPCDGAPSYTLRADGSGKAPGGVQWIRSRPATSVCGDPRLSPPGYRGKPEDYAEDGTYKGERSMDKAVRITIEEASVLQGFRPDYPWRGTKTSTFRQIGNAVPPPWAAAILGALIGDTP